MKSNYEDNSDKFIRKMEKANKSGLIAMNAGYAKMVKNTLDTPPPRTGRIYYGLRGKDVHRASAEGEPPAPLTRALIKSINTSWNEGEKVAYTFSDLDYSIELEFGAPNRNPPLGARPFFKPTLDAPENRRKLMDLYQEGFKEEMK